VKIAVALIALKVALILLLGEQSYALRLNKYISGMPGSTYVRLIMAPDPVTLAVKDFIEPYIEGFTNK